jgi:hypothetical protein
LRHGLPAAWKPYSRTYASATCHLQPVAARQPEAQFRFARTSGSDFHEDLKPEGRLGSGCEGNLNIP